MQIHIIGAGPIGGQTAFLLAKKGFEVHLYEEHPQVGKPIQCTGLMTISLNEVLPEPKNELKEALVNTTEHVQVIAPNNEKIDVKSKEYIVDRTLFDSHFVNKAVDAGCILHDQHRFIKKENGSLVFKDIKNNETKEIKRSQETITIGADGPLSAVAKEFGLFGQREFFYGIQVRASGNFDSNSYQAYFGNEIAPQLFAWVVPESSTIARVGLGTRQNTNQFFQKFMQQHNFKQIDMQAGPIPIYNPKLKTQDKKERVYLVGDAATQVKATTLGGLIPGLKAASCLAEAIAENKNYEQLWKKKIGRDLWLHLKARKTLDKFSDADLNKLIVMLNRPKARELLEKYDREKPFKLLSIIFKQPKLIYFAKHLL